MVSFESLRRTIESAGEILRRRYSKNIDFRKKTDGTIVTGVDLECDRFLREQLQSLYDIPVLSEETSDEASSRFDHECLWIVDPLDGTKEYVAQIPEFAISIGLVHKGEVIAGAVYNPISGEGGACGISGKTMFWGCSEPTNETLVSRIEFLKLKNLYPTCFKPIKPIGSIAYKLLLVAAGRARCTFTLEPKSAWDICGGLALIRGMNFTYESLDDNHIKFDPYSTRHRGGLIAGRYNEQEAFSLKNVFLNNLKYELSKK